MPGGARVIVLRDDGPYQVPEAFLASRGHIRKPVTRRAVERGEPLDLYGTPSFLRKTARRHEVPEFTSRLEDRWGHHDDTIVLKANFRGYPEPLVWFKGQEPVVNDTRHMINTTDFSTELVIFNAQKEDAGFYSCRIENDEGIREDNCQVYIGDTGRLVSKDGKSLTPAAANYRTYRSSLYTPSFFYSRYPGTWM
ncbi:hypothetical protein M3Y99_01644500 [Aphelenchoides fujianensis]|nr:hypothetical protein M3Y99_01958400 [Aphelenchoides fujianensis]KAI6219610.1 hypothetical protein M3Y99_01644500 [Aphelenchoides fujianensis]